MDQPEIAGKTPIRVTLEPGEHHWCSCGRSASGLRMPVPPPAQVPIRMVSSRSGRA